MADPSRPQPFNQQLTTMSDMSKTIIGVAMSVFTSGWLLGLWLGSRTHRNRDPDWRRSFNHENVNQPSGPPPRRLRRSGDVGPLPTLTSKPKITPKGQGPR